MDALERFIRDAMRTSDARSQQRHSLEAKLLAPPTRNSIIAPHHQPLLSCKTQAAPSRRWCRPLPSVEPYSRGGGDGIGVTLKIHDRLLGGLWISVSLSR